MFILLKNTNCEHIHHNKYIYIYIYIYIHIYLYCIVRGPSQLFITCISLQLLEGSICIRYLYCIQYIYMRFQ